MARGLLLRGHVHRRVSGGTVPGFGAVGLVLDTQEVQRHTGVGVGLGGLDEVSAKTPWFLGLELTAVDV